MSGEPTIDEIRERLAGGLEAAFPELVRAVGDGLYSGALRMIGDPDEAEDVAQDALIRAYRALAGYPPERIRSLHLEAWVWTIAANLCRNRIRARARRRLDPITADPADGTAGPEERALQADAGARLAAQVARLPWAMRSAVVLRHVVGLGYAEIAEALGRPEGTVKSDAHRGLARLRAALEEEEA